MTIIQTSKKNLLMAALAVGVFSAGTLLPVEGFSANCGDKAGKGVVSCNGNDDVGGVGTSPAPAPAPAPEPDDDVDDCGDCD